MNFEEKCFIVVSSGFSPEDTETWFKKYQVHRSSATGRDLTTHLTFDEYMSKVSQAGLVEPEGVGKRKGQFVLGRLGDVGDYTVESCRFIPVEQNHHERYQNGRHVEGFQRRFDSMVGQTKENNERVRKSAETRTGRTKETNEGHARQAAALAKSFVLVDSAGVVHEGTNVADFCKRHDLRVFSVYDLFAGRRTSYKGWTGNYVDPRNK